MSKHLVRSALGALATLATLFTLIGCGMGVSDSSTSPLLVPAFSGKAIGGQMPIIGATVKLYATTSTAYGTGSFIEEATQQGTSVGQDTDSGGAFSFAGPVTCPAGQFAYIVVSGGNTGANAVNANAVLVAALGRCEDLYTSTSGGTYDGSTVYINELTTIAAAYALGNFSTVSGTGAATVVGIGADATNNAAKVSGVSTGCVSGVGSCTTTATAGLAHAFQNAASLVNPFYDSAVSGANAAPPTDSAAVVPQQLLDTIGNILVACVNSTGGAAGDGSACGQIFTATTIGSNVPANTFSAMVNLAANPTLSGSAVNVASLYAVAQPTTSVYSPALATATGLNDFTVAINYPKLLGAATTATATCSTPPCQGLEFPTSGALDINDVYYVGNQSASGGSVPVNLFAFSSDGTLLSTTGNGSTLKFTFGLSVDALGNGYFGNGSASGTSALGVFTTGGGSLSQYTIEPVSSNALKIYNTAVDKANNVWVFGAISSGSSSLFMSPTGGASFTAEGAPGGTPPSNGVGLSIDPDQNIWTAAATTLSVLQNTGTASAPSYSSSNLLTDTTGGSPAIGITFTGTGPYTAYVSSYNTTAGIQPYAPTYTGAEVTALGQGALNNVSSTITGTYFNEADGGGNVWLADANSHSVIQFNPTNTTAYRYEPCFYVAGTTNACTNIFTTGKPFTVSIDSAGSIWVTAQAGGNVVQIIGAAAPTWPLLSLGKTGKP
jgi:hypothetical protein